MNVVSAIYSLCICHEAISPGASNFSGGAANVLLTSKKFKKILIVR